MNSKTIFKRTLPLIIALVVVIITAVSCTLLTKDKKNPTISNGDESFLTVGDITIDNNKVYQKLKDTIGLDTLVELLDKKLLSDVDGVNYYGSVTDKEINEEIVKSIFTDSSSWDKNTYDALTTFLYGSDATEAELAELKDIMFGEDDIKGALDSEKLEAATETVDNWRRNMLLSFGCKTFDDIKDHNRVIIARKAYAKKVIADEYEKSVTEYEEKKAEYDEKKAQYDVDYAKYTADLEKYNDGTISKKPTKPTEPKEPVDTRTVTKDAIDSYYKSNYASTRSSVAYGDLWLINVTFESSANAKNALKQLGITIKKNPEGANDWYWANDFSNEEDDVILTETEVIDAFVALYNNQTADKHLDNKVSLTRSEVDNLLVELNKRYKGEEYNKEVFNAVKDELYFESYSTTYLPKYYYGETSETNYEFLKTFTADPYSYNSVYNLTLKLGYIPLEEQNETINDEILKTLLDNKATDAVVNNNVAKLRNDNKLIIFDSSLEARYVSSFTSDYKTTKKASKNIVAAMGDFEVSADDMFDIMSKRYGVLLTVDTYQRQVLLQSKYNKIYDVINDKVLDKKEWKAIGESVQDEKRYLSAGAYASYGFNANYGWTQFLHDYYGVNNESELKVVFVYQKAMLEYIKENTSLDVEVNENANDVWNNVVVPAMNETYDKYFSLTGVHLLIAVMEGSNPVDPSKWHNDQVSAAKELYDLVLAIVNDEDKNPNGANTSTILADIVSDFALAPRWTVKADNTFDETSDDTLDITYKYPTIDYAKYKTLGLSVKNESLTITPGTMVEEFENATKAIWKFFEAKGDHTNGYKLLTHEFASSLGLTSEANFYLATKFGYHVYANLSSAARSTATVDGEKITLDPRNVAVTMQDAAKYMADKTDDKLSEYVKSVYNTFLTPVMTEMSDTNNGYYYNLKLANDMVEVMNTITYADNVNSKPDYVDKTTLEIILDYYIENYFSNLKYVSEKDTDAASEFETANATLLANASGASDIEKAKFVYDYETLSAWAKAALNNTTVDVYYTFVAETFETKFADVISGASTSVSDRVNFIKAYKLLHTNAVLKLKAATVVANKDAITSLKAEATNFDTTYATMISTFNGTAYTNINLNDAITYAKAYKELVDYDKEIGLSDIAKSAYTKATKAIKHAAEKFEEDEHKDEAGNFFNLIDAVAQARYNVASVSSELLTSVNDFVTAYEALDDLVKDNLTDRTIAVYNAVKAYLG